MPTSSLSDEGLCSPGAVTTASTASTVSNPAPTSSASSTHFASGGIMRGEQTVKLIQLYHLHHPDIGRNTQDGEGRKIRNVLWAKITEELNISFATSFTQEQFKKKVQNVQCTSRQKMQAGKRNLGDAELEYVRLFEPEKLGGGELVSPSSSIQLDEGDRREAAEEQSAAAAIDPCVASFKLEHFLEVLASTAAANGGGGMGEDGGAVAKPVDSRSVPLDATQQLAEILAVVANSTATGNNACSSVLAQSPLGSQSALRRKGRKGAMASGGLLTFDSDPLANTNGHSPPATKVKKRRNAGGAIDGDGDVNREESTKDGEWGRKMLEMQRNIVSAQRQILRLLEQQTRLAGPVPNTTLASPPSPPSTSSTTTTSVSPLSTFDYASTTKPSAEESATATLNSKLDALTSALLRIDSTLRERLPLLQPSFPPPSQ